MQCQPELHATSRRAIVAYIMTGRSETVRADAPSPFDMKYTLDGYVRFTDPGGFPAVSPPWGTLTAIDMNRGTIAWQVPLGESGLSGTGERKLWRTGGHQNRASNRRVAWKSTTRRIDDALLTRVVACEIDHLLKGRPRQIKSEPLFSTYASGPQKDRNAAGHELRFRWISRAVGLG